jgi:hypothetical protein
MNKKSKRRVAARTSRKKALRMGAAKKKSALSRRFGLATPGRPRVHLTAAALGARLLPSELLDAKRTAVSRYLDARPMARRYAAYSIDPHPSVNIVGVGVGRRIVDGEKTNELCVRFYVERKLALDLIPPELRLPKEVAGYPTDVIQSGVFRALQAKESKLRPAQPGCSVGVQFPATRSGVLTAGTLGAIVADKSGTYILSNNHVLADENRLPLGSPVFQPGLLDGGIPAVDRIAVLERFVRLDVGQPNRVDAAIARVTDPVLIRCDYLPNVGALHSGNSVPADEDMLVEKVGRSGYRQGRVFERSAEIRIQYDIGVIQFENQLFVEGVGATFSEEGDSGSLVVATETKRPVGLLCGGSGPLTVVNPIEDVLDALQVTISI